MKQERDDWVTPDIPKPARLTENEAAVIHRELAAGASEEKLALYFNTSVKVVRQAFAYIKRTRCKK
jgi:hypothetical protein